MASNKLLILGVLALGIMGGIGISYHYKLEDYIDDYRGVQEAKNFTESLELSGGKDLGLTAEEKERQSQRNHAEVKIRSWVALASAKIMTFGFHDYRQRLDEASGSFTKDGWSSFAEALTDARIIESIEASSQVITAVPSAAPVIISNDVVDGREQWVVQMPMVMTYQSGSKARTDKWLTTLVIVRVPESQNPDGLAIAQWVASY